MTRMLGAVAVAAALGIAPAAGAQQWAIDVKAGYAVPVGNIRAPAIEGFWGPMTNLWSAEIPIEVAGRYRFSPHFSAGIYFQYDPAIASSFTCASGMSCSAYDMRAGVEAVFALLPDRTLNPWLSAGSGWEWTHFAASTSSASAAVTYSGWEWFNAQAGLDWNFSKTFVAGPWVGVFGGSYTSFSGTRNGNPQSGTIASGDRSFHAWIQFGLKGTVNL